METRFSSENTAAEQGKTDAGKVMMAQPSQDDHSTREETVSQSPKFKKPWWRRLLKVFSIVVGSLVGLFLLVAILVSLILTPSRLTPIVNRVASHYLNATVHFDTVRLSLFENFPHVSLELKNGEVISGVFSGIPDSLRYAVPQRADSLLRFKDFAVTLNLPRLLASQVVIRELKLVDPQIYAFVSPAGNANWDIFPSGADTTASTQTDTTSDMTMLFGLRVGRVMLKGAELQYESRRDAIEASLDSLHLYWKSHRKRRYEIDLGSEVSMRQGKVAYAQRLPLSLKGGFAFGRWREHRVMFDKLTLQADNIPVEFNGQVVVEADSVVSDLVCKVSPLQFQRVLSLVPEAMMPAARHFQTSLSADLETRVTGTYRFDNNVLPTLRLDCKVNGGYLGCEGSKVRIDDMQLDASLFYHPQRPDSTGVILRKFSVEGIGMKFRAEGTAWDVLRDARVQGKMDGSIDLGRLTELFPSQKKDITAHGEVGLEANVGCRLSELNLRRIGNTRIHAKVTLQNLLVNMPQDTLFLMANGGRIVFGANPNLPEYDTTIAAGAQVVYLDVQADTLQFDMKEMLAMSLSGGKLTMRNAVATDDDTTVVRPFTGSVNARYLGIDGVDSSWVKIGGPAIDFLIMPSAKDSTIPVIRLQLASKGMVSRSIDNICALRGVHADLEATLYSTRRQQAQRREHWLDSLQRVYPDVPRDSLFGHVRALFMQQHRGQQPPQDDFIAQDIDMRMDQSIRQLLYRWNVNGNIKADGGRLITPYFPLTNTLRNVDIGFTTDRVELRGTTIRSGASDLNLTGEVANLKRALSGRGKLRINMQLESDTLDINELVKAASAGSSYMTASDSYKDSLHQAVSEEHLQQMIEQQAAVDTAAETSLIVVPGNVDIDVDLDVKHGVYADLTLSKLSGCLIVHDRCLQLNDLEAVTDAGTMKLTGLYATRSKKDITTGFDLEMQKIQVARLIKLIPSVDTLLPMLRSFEGVVDCQMAATAALDTAMNIQMPTLNAACRIHGQDMVLLDGETFTEISKMLHFKNKKRNMIDKISVEMLVHDSQIDIFPFAIEMDRYRAAVSGIQKLDMNFDYHISVLKSPIPFRLGIDIYGNPDKFKFRICRARYKSIDVPSYVEVIDSARLNLRRNITDIFRRGVEAATLSRLRVNTAPSLPTEVMAESEQLTAADSALLRKEGLLPGSDTTQGAGAASAPATGADTTQGTSADPLPTAGGDSSQIRVAQSSSEALESSSNSAEAQSVKDCASVPVEDSNSQLPPSDAVLLGDKTWLSVVADEADPAAPERP